MHILQHLEIMLAAFPKKKILTNNKYCRGSPKNNPKRPVKDCRFFGKHTLCQNHLVNAAFQQSQEYHSRSWAYSIIVPSIVRSECNPAQRCLNLTHSLTSVKKKKKITCWQKKKILYSCCLSMQEKIKGIHICQRWRGKVKEKRLHEL